jgi:hypothetical protein
MKASNPKNQLPSTFIALEFLKETQKNLMESMKILKF